MKSLENEMFKLYEMPFDAAMAKPGSSLLRDLQNNSLSLLDLLVRESLQNSLDAAKFGAEKVRVDYHLTTFDNEKVAEKFEKISEKLKSKSNQALIFSDKNTTGLNGKIKPENKEEKKDSKFYKLIRGMGENQTAAGAGGSFGIGKISYYSLGCGLVLYYTRIFEAGEYKERLIGQLIENAENENALLPNSEGVAWFGKSVEANYTIPFTDSSEIADFLSNFNLKTYENDETGTMVIIPFADNVKSDDLENAILRWYNPRINNQKYGEHFNQAYLEVAVNDEILQVSNVPEFEKFQQLYKSALLGNPENPQISLEKIEVNRKKLEDKIVGNLAFMEISKANLAELLEVEDTEANIFLAFSRKPGMIVKFDTKDWSSKVNLDENSAILAFFVPDSANHLSENYEDKNLEAYLRRLENADHNDWEDKKSDEFKLIKPIQNACKAVFQAKYAENIKTSDSTAIEKLAKQFGVFMPPKSSGTSKKTTKAQKVRESVPQMANLTIDESKIVSENKIRLKTTLFLDKGKSAIISLSVSSQYSASEGWNAQKWQEDFGENVQFPFEFDHFNFITGYLEVERCENSGQLKVIALKNREIFSLDLTIISNDLNYQPLIHIRKDDENGEK